MQNKAIKKVISYYNNELYKLYKAQPLAVQSYMAYKRITKPKISIETKQKYISEIKDILKLDFSVLSSQVDDVLLENYKNSGLLELLNKFEYSLKKVMQNERLTHVTDLDKEKLNNTLIAKHNLTMYEESEGNFVFASSNEVNKYRYGLRSSHGMIRVGENAIVLPSMQNLEISNRVKLKKPVYSYLLSPTDFNPVYTVKMAKRNVLGKSVIIPCLFFDNEWVSEKNIDLTNIECETITDVTPALKDFNVYIAKGENIDENLLIAHTIRMSKNPRDELKEQLECGKLIHLNSMLKLNSEKNLLV